jgi:hypothetical protein
MRVPLRRRALLLSLVVIVGCSDADHRPLSLDPEPDPTRYVIPGDFSSIGEALRATTVGDTVLVGPGTYAERDLVVPRSVHLIGAGADHVVIDATGLGGGSWPVVQTSDRIEDDRPARIRGLRVRGDTQILFSAGDGDHVLVDACVFESSTQGVRIDAPRSFAQAVFDSCVFRDVEAERGAAALAVQGYADVVVRQCTFRDNRGGSGPALRLDGTLGTVQVLGSTFVDNQNDDTVGGAVVAYRVQDLEFRSCTFENNDSSTGGGAVFVRRARQVLVVGGSFRNNRAGSDGGAIGIDDVSGFVLAEVDLFDNEARHGGALHLRDTRAFVDQCVFARNGVSTDTVGDSSGGAIRLDQNVRLDVDASIFHANRARGFAGRVDEDGGGSSLYATASDLRTNVLALNGSALVYAPEGAPLGGAFADLLVRTTNVFGNVDGDWVGLLAEFEGVDGNMSIEPDFCAPEEDDFEPCGS